MTNSAWSELTEPQKEASRNARNEQGIPTRKASIKSLSTQMEVEEVDDEEEVEQARWLRLLPEEEEAIA